LTANAATAYSPMRISVSSIFPSNARMSTM
jgi:hypothetical protein